MSMNMIYEIVRPTHNSETNNETNELVTPTLNSNVGAGSAMPRDGGRGGSSFPVAAVC